MSSALLDTVLGLLDENCSLQKQMYIEEFSDQINPRGELLLGNVIEMLAAKKQRLEDRLACIREYKLPKLE